MDTTRFDDVIRKFAEGGTRRNLLATITAGVAALVGFDVEGKKKAKGKDHHGKSHGDGANAERKHKKKNPCKKTVHKHGKRKKVNVPDGTACPNGTCQAGVCTPVSSAPDSKPITCADKCGDVTGNCGQAEDCGDCACDPSCPVCQTCNPDLGTCQADNEGDSCGDCEVCGGGICATTCTSSQFCDQGFCAACENEGQICPSNTCVPQTNSCGEQFNCQCNSDYDCINDVCVERCPGDVCTTKVTPDHLHGWQIIPDGTVPFGSVAGLASIGTGSIQFGPIDGSPGANKFVMQTPYNGLVSALTSFSYDFLIDSDSPGGAGDSDHFYVNVYVDDAANGLDFFGPGPGSTGFYDCRYDLAPAAGVVGGWTTNSFNQASAWTFVANRSGTCPATLADLTPGSKVIFIRINGGDSSSSDAGVKGGFDNVVIAVSGEDTQVYDFEPNS